MAATTASAVTASRNDPAAQLLHSIEDLYHYYRQRGLDDTDLTIAELEFAVALTRYRFAPPKGKLVEERLHVMVFGGAGSGKSTTVNVLVGTEVAEVNAQAGYTRHPNAFFTSDETRPEVLWPERLGTLTRTDARVAANVDEDRFGWRQLTQALPDPGFLRRHVVWDGPDLTAKDSTHYQKRVIEIAALAEITVYVASDERYNDELPTNFLQAMLLAGKWVVVVLTKVNEEDSDQFVQLFRDQVVSRLENKEQIVAVLPIPSPPSGRFKELWTDAFPHGGQLREAIENACGDFATARRNARQAAASYLHRQQSRMLEPLRIDLGEWKSWTELVRNAANDAVKRYEREYLVQVRYAQFEQTQQNINSLLQPSGVLQPITQALEIARTPYRLLRSSWKKLLPALAVDSVDEDRCLDRVRRGLLESLQLGCSQRKNRHRIWKELHAELAQEPEASIEQAFQQARGRQRIDLQQRIQRAVRKIQDTVEVNPVILNGLRVARVAADILAIALALVLGYRSNWMVGLLLVPLGIGLSEELALFLSTKYLRRHRAGLVVQQKENIRELIQIAYIDRLLQMPRSIGGQLYSLANLEDRLLRELAAAMGEGESNA